VFFKGEFAYVESSSNKSSAALGYACLSCNSILGWELLKFPELLGINFKNDRIISPKSLRQSIIANQNHEKFEPPGFPDI
jgi:hypothetical protein